MFVLHYREPQNKTEKNHRVTDSQKEKRKNRGPIASDDITRKESILIYKAKKLISNHYYYFYRLNKWKLIDFHVLEVANLRPFLGLS